jgi:hypothetical protein
MDVYQEILTDLLQVPPVGTNVLSYPPPYESTMDKSTKFDLIKGALRRARSLEDRVLTLVNAYYLGQFLEVEAGSQRGFYSRQLTTHYRLSSTRLYYLFELHGISHLARTSRITLTMIRKLTQEEYQSLVLRSNQIFNGVENFVGE